MRIGDGLRDGTLTLDRGGRAGTPPPKPNLRPEREGPSPFQQVLHGLGRAIDRGEATVRGAVAAGGKDLGTTELLALQVGVYRYSEVVDLSAKLVDRATSGIKTVIQGQ